MANAAVATIKRVKTEAGLRTCSRPDLATLLEDRLDRLIDLWQELDAHSPTFSSPVAGTAEGRAPAICTRWPAYSSAACVARLITRRFTSTNGSDTRRTPSSRHRGAISSRVRLRRVSRRRQTAGRRGRPDRRHVDAVGLPRATHRADRGNLAHPVHRRLSVRRDPGIPRLSWPATPGRRSTCDRSSSAPARQSTP